MMVKGGRNGLTVRRGHATSADAQAAVAQLHAQIAQPDMALVVVFCSSRYDLKALGTALKAAFPCPVAGCTTAGELFNDGYHEGGIVGFSLSSQQLHAHHQLISPLSRFDMPAAVQVADDLRRQLILADHFDPAVMVGFLMADGLSMLEEQLVAYLHAQLEGVSIVGGSAGDDLKFEQTGIYHDGRFLSDAASLILLETSHPFHIFKMQHFKPTQMKVVITDADPPRRVVNEINGEPAAIAYAGLLGVNSQDLNPMVFAAHPLMLKIGGEYYVRSIQKVNPDNSLTFYCAIDTGLVLTVAQGVDLVKNLEVNLAAVKQKMPEIQLVIGCDCILRRLEVMQKSLQDDVTRVLKDARLVGFSTYGEQLNSIHVNQTLTGIAIGNRNDPDA